MPHPTRLLGRLAAVVFLALLTTLAGCKKEPGSADGAGSAQSGDKVINLYVFSEYVPDDVLADFTKETGVKVNVQTLPNNEELFTKLKSGTAEYDVVSASDYMVRRLAKQDLVRKLDRARLTNFASLDPALLGKPFDPGNDVSVPLFWGVTGIGYNKAKTGGPVDSWAALFDPKYGGNICMLDDPRELLAAALWTLGKTPNERDPVALAAAAAKLREQKPLVRLYDTDNFAKVLAKGEVVLAQAFNGQVAKEMPDRPDLAFVVPKEGATLWVDNLCVPARSKRADHALTLIDYLMRPSVAAKLANYAAYATPNQAARPQVDPKLLNNPAVYPLADVLERCATMEDLGESNKLVDGLMQELKG